LKSEVAQLKQVVKPLSARINLLSTFLGLPVRSSVLPTVDEVTDTDSAQSGTTKGDSTTRKSHSSAVTATEPVIIIIIVIIINIFKVA